MTPNLSPIGSLTINYKKRQAMEIDNENMRLMRRILDADPCISQRKFDQNYSLHRKYRRIAKKGLKQGFDLEKMTDQQRKQYGHIECRTSSKLLPAIAGAQQKQHVRSRSDLNVNPGVQLESIQELTRVHEHVPHRAPKVQHYTAQAIFDVEEYPKKIKRVRHPRNLSNVFNTEVDVNLSKKRKVKKAKRAQNEMILGNYEINNISSLLDNSVEESDFNMDTSRQDEVVPQPPMMKASPRQPPKTFTLNSKLAKAPKEASKRSEYVRNLQIATTTYQVPSDLKKPEPAVRVQLIKPNVSEKLATPES